MHKSDKKDRKCTKTEQCGKKCDKKCKEKCDKKCDKSMMSACKDEWARLTVKGAKQKNAIVRKIRKKQHQRKCKKSSFDFKRDRFKEE